MPCDDISSRSRVSCRWSTELVIYEALCANTTSTDFGSQIMALVTMKSFRLLCLELRLGVNCCQPETKFVWEKVACTTCALAFYEWVGPEVFQTGAGRCQWFACSGATTSSHLLKENEKAMKSGHEKPCHWMASSVELILAYFLCYCLIKSFNRASKISWYFGIFYTFFLKANLDETPHIQSCPVRNPFPAREHVF